MRISCSSVTAVQRTFSTYNTLYFYYNNICLLHLTLPFNRTKSNKASAAILQRPAMRTVGQSSNQGISNTVVFLVGSVFCLEIAPGGTPYNGLYRKAPPKRGITFSRLLLPVVQEVDSAIYYINHYLVEKYRKSNCVSKAGKSRY